MFHRIWILNSINKKESEKGVLLRDLLPWENIGIVGEIQLCRFFLFLGQIDCTNEVPVDEHGLLLGFAARNLLRREHIDPLNQGADDLRIQFLDLGVLSDLG